MREADISEIELRRSIIGVISDMDTYRLPDAKGWSSFARHLIGETDEQRQKLRDEVLNTSAADFQNFGEVLEQVAHSGHVVVMGSPDAIKEANKERPALMDVTKVL